jgi:glutamyl-Q tRNA(Asp) synthetase
MRQIASMPDAFVTRFAPSPTGRLHLGHAFSAIVGHAAARRSGGRWWLRIEDIDPGRSRPEHVAAIRADLAWLGLDPDGELLQSTRIAGHAAVLADLRARGLLYPCFCTRADIERAAVAPHGGETGAYPGTCRARGYDTAMLAARPHAWRLDLGKTGLPMLQHWTDIAAGPQAGRADAGGDPVLGRKDVATSYALACVLDDAAMAVNLVTRGADLVGATPLQRLLQQLLGLDPPLYLHHPLLTDAAGRRLAKRDGAAALRSDGADPRSVRAMLEQRAGPLLSAIDKCAGASTSGATPGARPEQGAGRRQAWTR